MENFCVSGGYIKVGGKLMLNTDAQ